VFVEKALRHLVIIGALQTDDETFIKSRYIEMSDVPFNDNTNITNIGKLMIRFPVTPRYAKIIILSNKLNLLEYGIILACLLSVENIFSNEQENNENNEKTQNNINTNDLRNILDTRMLNPLSDHITYMNVILTILISNDKSDRNLKQYCYKYKLNMKRIKELLDLIDQIVKIALLTFKLQKLDFTKMTYPTVSQQNLIYQILLSCFIDNVARKKVIYDVIGNEKDKNEVRNKKIIYECNENNEECQIHPMSIVAKTKPDLLIYKEILRENKTFLVMNTIIKPEWLYNIGGDLVTYNLDTINNLNEPFYNKKDNEICCFVNLKYGFKSWEIQNVRVDMKKDDDNYFRWFVRLLLEGKVIDDFKVIIY
jgi:ATP-dependent RNA helicase DHX37/DHR1